MPSWMGTIILPLLEHHIEHVRPVESLEYLHTESYDQTHKRLKEFYNRAFKKRKSVMLEVINQDIFSVYEKNKTN